MLTSRYCIYILSILFAWMNTVTAMTSAEAVILGLVVLCDERAPKVNFRNPNNRKWRFWQIYAPLSYKNDFLVREAKRINNFLSSYNAYHNNNLPACENDCESKMEATLQGIINANKQAGIADKNKFTEMTKEFRDDFHGLVKEIVDVCQSSDAEGITVIEVDIDKLNHMYTALGVVADKRIDKEVLEDFQRTYRSLKNALELMTIDVSDVNHGMLVRKFRDLLVSVKPHVVLFYHLYSVICETKAKKDDKTRQESIKKRINRYDDVINELTDYLHSDELEEEHPVTTIKQFINFFNDLRMTLKFLDQNTFILSTIYAQLIKKNIEKKYISTIAEHNKKNPVTKKLNYDGAKANEKSEVNLRLYITDQTINDTSRNTNP